MGCRHSSSPPETPVKLIQNRDPIVLKSKISVHRSQVINHQTGKSINSLSTSQLSITTKKTCTSSSSPFIALCLEQTLNGRDDHLIKRFELNTTWILFDISRTHILLLDDRQLRLINIETMKIETNILPLDCGDIQEITWSSKLNVFLLLTTDRLYQTSIKRLHPKPIDQIQFIAEGPRKSYMTVDGDDLIINRSFGYDIRRYSLSKLSLIQTSRAYIKDSNICITNIRLNSKKILALAISFDKKQFIDLVDLNTDKFIYRIQFDSNENILYPIDLHNNGQWFAKTCIPNVNIGHCLISSQGKITRLKLFPHQDNFIRSLCMSSDNQWILIVRQRTLEIYRFCTSLSSLVKY